MKKAIFFAVTVALVIYAYNQKAQAIFIPGYERPILRSEMKMLESSDAMSKIDRIELVMTKKDMSKEPSGLVLRIEEMNLVHKITEISEDECGSMVYSAEMRVQFENLKVSQVYLIDHEKRKCDDYQPHRWVLEMLVEGIGQGVAVGEPEVVFTDMATL